MVEGRIVLGQQSDILSTATTLKAQLKSHLYFFKRVFNCFLLLKGNVCYTYIDLKSSNIS